MSPLFMNVYQMPSDINWITITTVGSFFSCLTIVMFIIICCGKTSKDNKDKKPSSKEPSSPSLSTPETPVPPEGVGAPRNEKSRASKKDASLQNKGDSVAASKMGSLQMQSLNMQGKSGRKNRSFGKGPPDVATPGESMLAKGASFHLTSEKKDEKNKSQAFVEPKSNKSAIVKGSKSTGAKREDTKSTKAADPKSGKAPDKKLPKFMRAESTQYGIPRDMEM